MKAFIYGLRDPRDQRIRYVGKADKLQRRLTAHLSAAAHAAQPSAVQLWLAELSALQLAPVMETLEEVDWRAWPEAEKRWISKYTDLLNAHGGGGSATSPPHECEIALRVPQAILDSLKQRAAEDFTTVSGVVRQILARAVGYRPPPRE